MAAINLLIIAALIATVVVLTLGLRSMSRGGAYDAEHAEKFMWERIALQSLVIVLLIAAAILLNI
jgi:hypothetical protein